MDLKKRNKTVAHPYIHTIEYYSAMGRNELLIHVVAWLNLYIVILSERSQIKKNTTVYTI